MKISTQLKLVSVITVGALFIAIVICSWKLMILNQNFKSNQQMQTSLNQLARMQSTMLSVSRLDVMSPDITKSLQDGDAQIADAQSQLSEVLAAEQSEKSRHY
nr:hypothetical protein [uncultured Deefgea sp.]